MDNDGKVDYQEFIQAAVDHQALLNKKNLKAAFELLDENHDGRISVQELESVFGGGQNARFVESDQGRALLRDIMKEVDKNRDNFISVDEFNAACTMQLRTIAMKNFQ